MPCDDVPTGVYDPQCLDSCPSNKSIDYKSDKHYANSYYGFKTIEAVKHDIMTYGSVTAAFTVFEDFLTYQSGVYTHISGESHGGHAVKCIGWGVENGQAYWLNVNSWNNTWGDAGTFKISMEEGHGILNFRLHAGTV